MSKIDLVLEKHQFSATDKIIGRVVLYLDESTKAQKLSLKLIVTERVKKMAILSLNSNTFGVGNSANSTRSYSFDLLLGGEKEYMNGEEYPFEMSIPGEALPRGLQSVTSTLGGFFGGAIGVLSQLTPLGQTTYLYSVEARLDVPWKFDVTASTDITIG